MSAIGAVGSAADMTAAPRISMIVCTRNRVAGLRQTLDSIATAAEAALPMQVELIVVDNGSTDGTFDAVTAWAKGVKLDIRVFLETRPGLAAARNAGMRLSRGNIIAYTDDDCTVAEDYFVVLDHLHAEVAGPAMIGGRVDLGDPRDLPMTIKPESTPRKFDGVGVGGFVLGCNMSYNRDVMNLVGEMDERLGAGTPLKAAEETDYLWRAWRKGTAVSYAPELKVVHYHGRRSIEEARSLWRGYAMGNGAVYAKHFGSPIIQELRWNTKNAVFEAFGIRSFKPEIGVRYRSLLWGNILGMMLFWRSREKRQSTK